MGNRAIRQDFSAIDRVLLDEETIQRRVEELAAQISADYAGLNEDGLVLVGVLKGPSSFWPTWPVG